jgi:hypothetical protein
MFLLEDYIPYTLCFLLPCLWLAGNFDFASSCSFKIGADLAAPAVLLINLHIQQLTDRFFAVGGYDVLEL